MSSFSIKKKKKKKKISQIRRYINNNILLLLMSGTSSVGKVDMTLNQGVPGSNLDTAIWEKFACAVGQGNLPKVVLDNDHLLSLDYKYGNGALEYVKHS